MSRLSYSKTIRSYFLARDALPASEVYSTATLSVCLFMYPLLSHSCVTSFVDVATQIELVWQPLSVLYYVLHYMGVSVPENEDGTSP